MQFATIPALVLTGYGKFAFFGDISVYFAKIPALVFARFGKMTFGRIFPNFCTRLVRKIFAFVFSFLEHGRANFEVMFHCITFEAKVIEGTASMLFHLWNIGSPH